MSLHSVTLKVKLGSAVVERGSSGRVRRRGSGCRENKAANERNETLFSDSFTGYVLKSIK